jgi:IS30 family transposase
MIFQRCSFGEIAKKINKDRSTISREIRRHSVIKKTVTAVSVLTLVYIRKPAKWVWCVEISVLKPLASCAEPADIVMTIAINLQSRFVS